MHDPKKPVEPVEPATPPTREQPKKGGFGAFAEVYRARWTANHPNMRPREATAPTDAAPEPPAPADLSETRPHAEEGTRLLRPWERS